MDSKKEKPLNKRSKGIRVENILRDIYKEQGWKVEKKPWTKWGGKDFFGKFDLLCVKHSRIEFVQVKSTDKHYKAAIKDIGKWLIENQLDMPAKVAWYKGGSEWEIAEFIDSKWIHYPFDKTLNI